MLYIRVVTVITLRIQREAFASMLDVSVQPVWLPLQPLSFPYRLPLHRMYSSAVFSPTGLGPEQPQGNKGLAVPVRDIKSRARAAPSVLLPIST